MASAHAGCQSSWRQVSLGLGPVYFHASYPQNWIERRIYSSSCVEMILLLQRRKRSQREPIRNTLRNLFRRAFLCDRKTLRNPAYVYQGSEFVDRWPPLDRSEWIGSPTKSVDRFRSLVLISQIVQLVDLNPNSGVSGFWSIDRSGSRNPVCYQSISKSHEWLTIMNLILKSLITDTRFGNHAIYSRPIGSRSL